MVKVLKYFIVAISFIVATNLRVYGSSVQDVGTYYPGEKKILSFPQSVWGNGNTVGGATSSRTDLVEVWDWNSTGATLMILKGVAGKSIKVYITVDYYDASKNFKRESYVFSLTVKTNPIQMTETSLSMVTGETHQLSYKGTVAGKPVPDATWSSSNTSVASVGFTGIVTAKSGGTALITATSTDGETTTCTISVTGSSGGGDTGGTTDDKTPADLIDLGLSVKWTKCNLGASSPYAFGNKYAWGAVTPSNNNLSDSPGTTYTFDYSLESKGVIKDGHFTPEYDACTQLLGEGYRVPTKEEWQELSDNCTWEAVVINGVRCIKGVSKKNGAYIIFPRTFTTAPGLSIESKVMVAWSCTHYFYGRPWAYFSWESLSSTYTSGTLDTGPGVLYDNVERCFPLRAVYDEHAGNEQVIIDTNLVQKDIYNLQGVCLKRNATEEEVETLAPGLYIIGGKKVLVK